MEPDAATQGTYAFSPAPLVHSLMALLAKSFNEGVAQAQDEPFVLPPLSDLQLLPEALWDGHPAAPAFDGREWEAPHHVLALTMARPNLPDGTPQERVILGHVHPGTYIWGQFRGLGVGADPGPNDRTVLGAEPAACRRPHLGDVQLYVPAQTALEMAYDLARVLVDALTPPDEGEPGMLTPAMAREVLSGGIAEATLVPYPQEDLASLAVGVVHPIFLTQGPDQRLGGFMLTTGRAYPCVALWLPFSTRLATRSHGLPPVLTASGPVEGSGRALPTTNANGG